MLQLDCSAISDQVRSSLAQINNAQIQKQVSVPVILSKILPVGLLGAFMTLILGSFISSVSSSLHSWGSIFIRDVIMPQCKTGISPARHLAVLKWSTVGVAGIVFFFSLLFRQVSYIMMWMSITAAMYAGAGAVIIGGLYWKRGTTAGAWTALIVGLTISTSGIVIKQIDPSFFINEQVISFIAMISSLACYVMVSLLSNTFFIWIKCFIATSIPKITVLCEIGSASLGWDENGRLSRGLSGYKFYYNWDGKLRDVNDSSNNPLVTLQYDPMGNRVYKWSSTQGPDDGMRYIVDVSGELPTIVRTQEQLQKSLNRFPEIIVAPPNAYEIIYELHENKKGTGTDAVMTCFVKEPYPAGYRYRFF